MNDLLTQTLEESPLFKHLSSEELQTLRGASLLQVHQTGALIIQEGSLPEFFYIVISGRVRVWTRGPMGIVELKTMGPGAYFGEVSLLSGNAATASVAVSTGPAQLLAIEKPFLIEHLKEDEKLRKILLGVTLGRAKDTIRKVFK